MHYIPTQEHIHVYSPPEEEHVGSYVAPFHTDSGVLLLITPAPELPLQVARTDKIGNSFKYSATCTVKNLFFLSEHFTGTYFFLSDHQF